MLQTQQWQEVQLEHEDNHLPYLAYIRTLRRLDVGLEPKFEEWLSECLNQQQLQYVCPILSRVLQRIQSSWRNMDAEAELYPWRMEFESQPLGHQYLDLVTEGSNSYSTGRRSSRISRRSSGRASRSSGVAAAGSTPDAQAVLGQQAAVFNTAIHEPLPPHSPTLSDILHGANELQSTLSGHGGMPESDYNSGQNSTVLVDDVQDAQYQQDQRVHPHDNMLPVGMQAAAAQDNTEEDPTANIAAVEGCWDWCIEQVVLALQQHDLDRQHILYMLNGIQKVQVLPSSLHRITQFHCYHVREA